MSRYPQQDLPDLTELLEKLRKNARFIIYGLVAVVILFTGYSSYFQVEADEEAVILRLGEPLGATYGPGLHFKLPFIDQVFKANVKKVYQLEFGFRTLKAGVQSEVDNTYKNESLMLTGDLGLVHVQWTVFYRIGNVTDYLFKVRNVEKTIRDVAEATVRLLVGDRSGDEVMTEHREQISTLAQLQMQESMDGVKAGVIIERVALRQVDPPREAQAAFNKVNEARARKQQMIEQAERAMVEAVEAAKGHKDEVEAEARGAKKQTIAEAEGEASKFDSLVSEYEKAPDVTRTWMYYQTVGRTLSAAGKKILVPTSSGGDLVKLLPLGTMGGALEQALGSTGPTMEAPQPPPERSANIRSAERGVVR